MNLHTTTEKAVAEFKERFSFEVNGNAYFSAAGIDVVLEQFLRETIASVAAEVADATVNFILEKIQPCLDDEEDGQGYLMDEIEEDLKEARTAYKETGV